MSFILDALKKSENKHRKRTAKTPRSIHEPVAVKPSRPRPWFFWLLLVLIINGVFLAWVATSWWLSPVQTLTESSADRVQSTAQDDRVREDRNNIKPELSGFDEDSRRPLENPTIEVAAEAVAPLVPRTDKTIYTLQQLPQSVRRRIPVLRLALHAYNKDNPQRSMVQLNGNIYREGDAVDEELTLESITGSGIVLHFDGYRFMVPRRGH